MSKIVEMMATIDLRIFELDMKQNYLKKNNNVCCETSLGRIFSNTGMVRL
jgi:hypothetical protein